jgi:hypothetical protein
MVGPSLKLIARGPDPPKWSDDGPGLATRTGMDGAHDPKQFLPPAACRRATYLVFGYGQHPDCANHRCAKHCERQRDDEEDSDVEKVSGHAYPPQSGFILRTEAKP